MPLLQVSNLTKTYAANTAVDDINFAIHEGRCVSLLGPNGAGKTTTLNMLSGLLSPTSGTIEFKGMNRDDDLRRYIGYLPQYPAFYNWMTGREFLEYAGRLTGLSKTEARERSDHLLQRVGIAEAKQRRISGYSGGMKQRLGLAQAMIHQPRLLILDEPVSALDPIGRRDVLTLMRELKEETTILFSTHVLHDAEGISDDVLIIHEGRIVISGNLQDVRAQHRQPMITIGVEDERVLDEWLPVWQKHELVSDIIREHHLARLVVNDVDRAKAHILHDIVTHHINIVKFEVAQTTLEDLFMKVVSK